MLFHTLNCYRIPYTLLPNYLKTTNHYTIILKIHNKSLKILKNNEIKSKVFVKVNKKNEIVLCFCFFL